MTTNIDTKDNRQWDIADLFAALMFSFLSVFFYPLIGIFEGIPKVIRLEFTLFVCLLTPTIYLLNKYPLTGKDFGFEKDKLLKIIVGGLICAFIISPRNFFFKPIMNPGEYDVVFTRRLNIFLSVTFSAFILPVMEEILFRGCIYRIIKNRYNIYLAIVITCLVFAIAHLDFIYAFTSLVFILGYEYTKCLNTSIFAHILLNSAYCAKLYLYA